MRSLELAAGAAPRSRPTPALKNKSSHDERTARTQRSRKRSVSFALRRAQKHVGGVGAREAATRKPDENPHEKHKRGAVRVRVARACDEEDFRDCMTGIRWGYGRERCFLWGTPGRRARVGWASNEAQSVGRRSGYGCVVDRGGGGCSVGPRAGGHDDGQFQRRHARTTHLLQPARAARLKTSRSVNISCFARCREAPKGAPGPLVRRPEQRRSSQPRPCRLSPVSRGRRPQAAKALNSKREWG